MEVQKKLENLEEKLSKLEVKKMALLEKKGEIRDEILPIRQFVQEAKVKAAANGEYTDPETFQSARDKLQILGRKDQHLQADLGHITLEKKQLNKEIDKLEKNDYVLRMKEVDERIKLRDRHMINWESFFIESAKNYLSGHEFEIISKMATNMLEIRANKKGD